jgi:hypothetical protein
MLMKTNSNLNAKINIIAFEEILDSISSYDSDLPTTLQIEELIELNDAAMVSLNNVLICSKELIEKLARIELIFLKQGEDAAVRYWYKLGLPEANNI